MSLKDSLKKHFCAVLELILPPCTTTSLVPNGVNSTITTSTNSNSNIINNNGNNSDSTVPYFDWVQYSDDVHDVSSTTEVVTLLLANELSLGGRLFNICVNAWKECKSQQKEEKEKEKDKEEEEKEELRLLLQTTLITVLTDYHCGASHIERDIVNTNITEQNNNNNNNNNNSVIASPMHESGCSLTLLVRRAASLIGRNESWGESFTVDDMENTDAVEDVDYMDAIQRLCVFVVSVAEKVAAAAAAKPFLSYNSPQQGKSVCKRERDEDACVEIEEKEKVKEEWFEVIDEDSIHQKEEEDEQMYGRREMEKPVKIADILSNVNNTPVDISSTNRETLSEVGSVIAALSKACEARTLLDASAWQYGRNRITLASMTVILQDSSHHHNSPPHEKNENHNNNNNNNNSNSVSKTVSDTDRLPVIIKAEESDHLMAMTVTPSEHNNDNNKNSDNDTVCVTTIKEKGPQQLVGYFMHETATLYTNQGKRYYMEIP